MFEEPVAPVGDADVMECRDFQCVKVWLDVASVGKSGFGGKWDPREEVCFGNYEGVAGAEHFGVFAGFIITLWHAQEDNTEMFTEVV